MEAVDSPVVALPGRSSVALEGPWTFHLGDNSNWADPGFDDVHWDPIAADRPWDRQGFWGYDGFAWYRLRLNLAAAPESREDLALFIPSVGDAYEVYWNGRLVGGSGSLPPHPTWYADSSTAVPLGPARSGVLALRVWRAPFLSIGWNDYGGLRAPPQLGLKGEIQAHLAALGDAAFRFDVSYLVLFPLYSLAVLLGLLAWVGDREKSAYLWMSCFSISMIAMLLGSSAFGWKATEPLLLAINRSGFGIRDISLWYMLLWLLDLRSNRNLRRITNFAARLMAGIVVLYVFLLLVVWASPWAHQAQSVELVLAPIFALPGFLSLGIVAVALNHRKRLNASRWILAIATVLTQLLVVSRNLSIIGLRLTHWTLIDKLLTPLAVVGGVAIHQHTVTDSLVLAALIFAFYVDSVENRRRHAQLEQELTNAREIQQVHIPEALPEIPGYALSSAYKPAEKVGGDFFQIVPLANGSTLIVLGDVSGKGLKAAMAVSLIVGALRVLADEHPEPASLLEKLNRRLHGRLQGGFATCIALLLEPDGRCSIASAGHPAPFLNARELDLPGALPLGLLASADYEQTKIQMRDKDHLALFTDGLLEARSPAGELYGFDRLKALFANRPAADEAAQAAVEFGQDDDITVLVLIASHLLAPESKVVF